MLRPVVQRSVRLALTILRYLMWREVSTRRPARPLQESDVALWRSLEDAWLSSKLPGIRPRVRTRPPADFHPRSRRTSPVDTGPTSQQPPFARSGVWSATFHATWSTFAALWVRRSSGRRLSALGWSSSTATDDWWCRSPVPPTEKWTIVSGRRLAERGSFGWCMMWCYLKGSGKLENPLDLRLNFRQATVSARRSVHDRSFRWIIQQRSLCQWNVCHNPSDNYSETASNEIQNGTIVGNCLF